MVDVCRRRERDTSAGAGSVPWPGLPVNHGACYLPCKCADRFCRQPRREAPEAACSSTQSAAQNGVATPRAYAAGCLHGGTHTRRLAARAGLRDTLRTNDGVSFRAAGSSWRRRHLGATNQRRPSWCWPCYPPRQATVVLLCSRTRRACSRFYLLHSHSPPLLPACTPTSALLSHQLPAPQQLLHRTARLRPQSRAFTHSPSPSRPSSPRTPARSPSPSPSSRLPNCPHELGSFL